MGVFTETTTLENYLTVSNKLDICKHYNPVFPFLGTHPQKGMHLCSKTHGSTIRKGPKLKRTQMSSYHRPTCILYIHTVENETVVEKHRPQLYAAMGRGSQT